MHTFGLSGATAIPTAVSTAFLRIRPEALSRRDSGRYVRFDPINVSFKIPCVSGSFPSGIAGAVETQFSYSEVGLKTAGDFKEGQKTVLGKLSGIDDETAIFVVISLKVLD